MIKDKRNNCDEGWFICCAFRVLVSFKYSREMQRWITILTLFHMFRMKMVKAHSVSSVSAWYILDYSINYDFSLKFSDGTWSLLLGTRVY